MRPTVTIPIRGRTVRPLASSSAPGEIVCILTQTDGFGGTEIHTLGLIELLHRRGHRIELVECGHLQYERALAAGQFGDGVMARITPLSVKADTQALRRWGVEFTRLRSRVLIFPMGAHDLASVGFLRLCRRRFDRIFLIEHLEPPPVDSSRAGSFTFALSKWRRRWAEQARAGCADRIITVSTCIRDRLLSDFGHPRDKLVVIPNGVRAEDFRRDPAAGRAFRTGHKIPAEAFVFGMLTRLHPVKGIDLALEALRHLPASLRRSVRLLVAGEGPLRASLERHAEELAVRDLVVFSGFVEAPLAALSASDIIVFSSRREGLPLGLLEAMAAGCVPIVTRVSGLPEVVDRPEVGWVVAPESPEELGRAMQKALELDRATLLAMRRAAEGRIRRDFDLDRSQGRFLEVCGL